MAGENKNEGLIRVSISKLQPRPKSPKPFQLENYLDEDEVKKFDSSLQRIKKIPGIRRPTLLILGETFSDNVPKWVTSLENLVGEESLSKTTVVKRAAVLLVANQDGKHKGAWGICFGDGRRFLDKGLIVADFGKHFALLNAQEDSITSINTVGVGERVRMERVTYPQSNHYWNFPIEYMTDIVERINGSAMLAGRGLYSIGGVNSLSLPIRLTRKHLVEDCYVHEVLGHGVR